MRRALVIVGTLGGLLLAGCGGGDDPVPTGPPDVVADPTADPPDGAVTQQPAPTATDGPTQTGEPTLAPPVAGCSSDDYPVGPPHLGSADGIQDVEDTVQRLLTAAMGCDQATLVELAQDHGTSLTFATEAAEEVLALPDLDGHYRALAALLSGTVPVEMADESYWVWPAAFSVDATEEDWQQLVEARLYTQEEVDQLRADEAVYSGWRVGVNAAGSWLFFVTGD